MFEKSATIALIEDDDQIRELLEIHLKNIGFHVRSFFSVEQLERKGHWEEIDLLVLDIMLPGENGLSFYKSLSNKGIQIPTIFLTALDQSEKLQQAMQFGAIDYITKPFELELFSNKIQNLWKQFIPRKKTPLPLIIGIARIQWDLGKIERNNQIFKLTPKESSALEYFVLNPNRVITREELLKEIWGKDVSGRNIDNILVKFRKLFEPDPANPRHFLTYSRKGYAYQP